MISEKFNFEQALQELENLINTMENNQLSLDESLKNFQQGSLLIKQCSKKLNETQKAIQILIKDETGNETIQNFSQTENNILQKKITLSDKQQIKKIQPSQGNSLF